MSGEPTGAPIWSTTPAGSVLTIVKLAPDGQEVTRYPGRVLPGPAPGDWLVAGAEWTHRDVEVGGLRFRPGDTLREYFSPSAWFNAFLVLSPAGVPRGWYANVTRPASMTNGPAGLTLYWHDLYLDVVVLAGGQVTMLDEDELADSGLEQTNSALHQRIITTRDLILEKVSTAAYPFDQSKNAQ